MKRHSLRHLFLKILFSIVIVLTAGTLFAQVPTITSFTPVSGPIGTAVTISGTNFSTTPADNIVWFGAVRATVNSATTTSLGVVVPAGASYQPMSVTVNGLTARSVTPFKTRFSSVRTIDMNSFASKIDFTTGLDPHESVINDIDGDGKPDLVVTNTNSNSISVYQNVNMTGPFSVSSFAGKVNFTTGLTPMGIAVGDIDGDGKQDLVVVNNTSVGSVSIFRNTSTTGTINSGSFAARVDLPAGDSPNSVSITDIDGDGKPDLTITNFNSSYITIYRNIGTSGSIIAGSFDTRLDFPAVLNLQELVLSDVDGDSKPDIVVPNFYLNTVSVFRNVSTPGTITAGSFEAKVDFNSGVNPQGLKISDIDGDGKSDMIVTNSNSSSVSVFRNTAVTGAMNTTSFEARVDYMTGMNPRSLDVGDIDGDGKPDLVVSNYSSSSVSVLRNKSTSGSLNLSSFESGIVFSAWTGPRAVKLGDMDSDGKPDIIVVNSGSNVVSVLRNIIPPPVPPIINSFSPITGPVGTTVTIYGSNFNMTASENIVWFGAVRANVVSGTSNSLIVTVPAGATYQPISVTTNELTAHSGKPFNITFPGSRIIDATTYSTKVDFSTGNMPVYSTVADIDGDGKSDLAVANINSNSISVFRNISASGSITTASFDSRIDFATGSFPRSVVFGDIDNDGKLDMVVANEGSNTVSVFRNTSTPGSITSSSFSSKVDFSVGANPFNVAIGDIDGDGKSDLAVANYTSDNVSLLHNTSMSGFINESSFSSKVDFNTGIEPYGVAIGDIDGDNKPEIVISNYSSSTISIFRNTSISGSINISSLSGKVDLATGTGTGPTGIALCDIDGDNKKDLLISNNTASTISIVRNISTLGTITTSSFSTFVDFPSEMYPFIIAVDDINGDGKPDVVAANFSGSVSVFRNISSIGSFGVGSLATRVNLTTGTESYGLSVCDIDGDSKPDIVVTNSGSNNLSVLRNTMVIPVPPTITSLTPAFGPIGTSVTITGTNFSTTPANNIVWFGAVRANVTASTNTTLTVSVPAGATYDPITVTVNGLTAYSSSPFNVTIPGTNTFDVTSLASKVNFTSGMSPSSVAIADIDGDGKSDLVVANSGTSSNTISIFRNISTAGIISASSFLSKHDLYTGSNPLEVAVSDIDGDGKQDIIVSHLNSNYVSVFRNISSSGDISAGSFSARVDLMTASSSYGVAVGDLDGDGKPDLAVTNYMYSTVSVFRNNSEPGAISTDSFDSRVDLPVDTYPYRVAIGDIDGDGKPDLAVTNWGSHSVSVLRNVSSPGTLTLSSFSPKIDFASLINPCQISIADIDGDGKHDITVTNSGVDSFSIFRNVSTSGSLIISSLAPRTDFIMGPAMGSRALAVADVDGDGKPDLVIGNTFAASNKVYVFRNTSTPGIIGAGSLAARIEFTAGAGVNSIAIGDVDDDGKPDLVVAYMEANSLSILRNKLSEPLPPPPPAISSFAPASGIVGSSVILTGSGFSSTLTDNIVWFGAVKASVTAASATQLTVTVPAGATYQPISITVNGLTGYSRAPFIITFQSSRIINATSFASMVEFASGTTPWSVAVGDIDIDGKPDLVVVNSTGNSVSVIRNTSISGSILSDSFAAKVDFSTGTNPQHAAIGDLDGDGKPDLVVTNHGSNTVSVYKNTSSSGSITSGSFAPKVDFGTGLAPFKVCIGDLDCDGKPDLVVTNYSDGTFSVLRNTSVPGSINSSSFETKFDYSSGVNPYFASIGDLDGDGKPDLAVANFNSSTVSVFRNLTTPGAFGSYSFDIKVDFFTSIGTICPVIGDLDSDGKPDLAVLNSHTNLVSVFRNISTSGSISSGSFEPRVDFTTSYSPHNLKLGDFDGDSKPDLIAGGVSIHRNTSISGTINTSSFATKVEINGGDSSMEIAVCDFDGDGRPDFALPNNTKNTISVFRNIIHEFAPPPPAITSFSPATGPVGSAVTITGIGFSTTLSANFVRFGMIQSTVTSASATQLTVIVPQGATTQPISVTVNMLTANSATSFTVTTPASPPPVISGFNPVSGGVGSTVVINGSNFSTNTSDNTVKFGNVQATVISATATQLTVTVPSGATTQPIYVTVNGLTAFTLVSFVISPPPAIASFLPTSGPVGTTVTINGTNFSSIPTDNIVRFGTVQTAVSSATSTQLTVIVPSGATTQPIYVTTNGLTANSATDFTVTTFGSIPPVITSFSPASGPVGATVTITGSNFGSDIASNIVKFGTFTASVTSATPGQLSVIVPMVAANQPIFVTVNGLTAFSATSFIVTLPPSIMSFSPTTGPVGTSVTIYGNNFGPAPSDNTVMFGTVQSTVTAATTTQLTVTVPAISTQQQISVTVNGLTANSPTPFTVITPPAITSFSPSSGTVGTQVTITGSDFSFNISNNTVRFGNVQAAVINATTNQLTVIVPAGTMTQPISVTVNGFTGTSGTSFIIIYPPVINSFNPQSGPVGTNVTISGSNFSTNPANNTVRFGSVQATVISATDTQLTVTVPAGAITQPISVTVNGLTAYTSSPFNIPPPQPPIINSFFPTSGPVGTTVTINGMNFSNIPADNNVMFGGNQATVTAASGTQLTVTVPNASGNLQISVNVNGLSGNSNNPFNITAAGENPSVNSFAFESSVITLNGDGVNDRLVIQNFETYGKCDISIYNSRGLLIFSQKDYQNDWDMTINGRQLLTGGYFYVALTEKGVFRGSFSILTQF